MGFGVVLSVWRKKEVFYVFVFLLARADFCSYYGMLVYM